MKGEIWQLFAPNSPSRERRALKASWLMAEVDLADGLQGRNMGFSSEPGERFTPREHERSGVLSCLSRAHTHGPDSGAPNGTGSSNNTGELGESGYWWVLVMPCAQLGRAKCWLDESEDKWPEKGLNKWHPLLCTHKPVTPQDGSCKYVKLLTSSLMRQQTYCNVFKPQSAKQLWIPGHDYLTS